jgi:hypothetical protein
VLHRDRETEDEDAAEEEDRTDRLGQICPLGQFVGSVVEEEDKDDREEKEDDERPKRRAE